MSRRTFLTLIGVAGLLAAVLACSINPDPITSTPGGPGSVAASDTPEEATVTEPPILPPPAMALVRVAYIKGGDVWLWTDGVGSMPLTFSGGASDPTLSPDARVVAFQRDGELWAVNSDGSAERQLIDASFLSGLVTAPDTAEVNDVIWEPGAHRIYFTTLTVAGIAGYRIPRFDLYLLDADAGIASLMYLEAPGSGGVPYVSPDGRVVALAQPDRVVFLEVTGAFYTVVMTFPSVSTSSEWPYVPELVWLGDSSGVRMVTPAPDPLGDPTQLSTFWDVPVSGTPTALTTFLAGPVFMSFPYVSPDGSHVLYMAQPSAGLADIHTIRSDSWDTFFGSYPSDSIGLLGWTPDSQHFMYWQVPTQARIMAIGEDNPLGDTPVVGDVQWVESLQYFYLNGNELRRVYPGFASTLIDSGVTEYDWGVYVY
jgi:hypothetical protein